MAQSPPEDATTLLASFASNLTFEQLPAQAVSTLKDIVLDTLGTTLGATTLGAGCQEIVDVARAGGGAPESTLIGFGDRIPVLMAAFANGGMGHALNYDSAGSGHTGALVPGPLAVAESIGSVSGKEYLTGLAVALEVTGRLNNAILKPPGFHGSDKFLEGQLINYFGVAVGAGRILKLSPGEMQSAFGLALMQASGSMQVVLDGDPPCKAIYAAFPNHGGVLSALLSKQGLGAQCNALEGRAGFFGLFFNGKYDREVLLGGLGKEFIANTASFKRWPTGGGIGSWIEAALRLKNEHSLQAADIDHVELRPTSRNLPWIEPLDERRAPQNSATASNSMPFWTAKAFVNGRCSLTDISPAGLRQPEALKFAERVRYSVLEKPTDTPAIDVVTTAGTRYSIDVDTRQSPTTHEQLVEKFLDCAGHSVRPLSKAALTEAVAMMSNLEDVPDVAVLPRLISS